MDLLAFIHFMLKFKISTTVRVPSKGQQPENDDEPEKRVDRQRADDEPPLPVGLLVVNFNLILRV